MLDYGDFLSDILENADAAEVRDQDFNQNTVNFCVYLVCYLCKPRYKLYHLNKPDSYSGCRIAAWFATNSGSCTLTLKMWNKMYIFSLSYISEEYHWM